MIQQGAGAIPPPLHEKERAMRVNFKKDGNLSRLELIKESARKMMSAKREEERSVKDAIRELENARREYLHLRMQHFFADSEA